MEKLRQWLNKWALYIYGGCALAWLVGYFGDWDALLWTGVVTALLATSVSETCEYHFTHRKWHLVIPVLTVVWMVACLFILCNRL